MEESVILRCTSLGQLWRCVNTLNEGNLATCRLAPIPGNGKLLNPRMMFVFINPTARNISSRRDWKGRRFPFCGTKQVWRVLCKAGMFDERLMSRIEGCDEWPVELAETVLGYLRESGIYITNVVKWTCNDARLPNNSDIRLFMPILKREIVIVRPKLVVTFGLIPFESLTGQKIRLSEYYENAVNTGNPRRYGLGASGFRTEVLPCYFPVGRGNPKRAIDILRLACDCRIPTS